MCIRLKEKKKKRTNGSSIDSTGSWNMNLKYLKRKHFKRIKISLSSDKLWVDFVGLTFFLMLFPCCQNPLYPSFTLQGSPEQTSPLAGRKRPSSCCRNGRPVGGGLKRYSWHIPRLLSPISPRGAPFHDRNSHPWQKKPAKKKKKGCGFGDSYAGGAACLILKCTGKKNHNILFTFLINFF